MFYRPAAQVPAGPLHQRNVALTRSVWCVGLRADQRGPRQLRDLEIVFPLLTRDLVQVRLGGTIATASVTCELVEPSPYRPKHGFFGITVRQLLHERTPSAQPEEVRRISAILDRVFRGGVIETEGLCVLPGRRVWSVAVEVLVLNDEGGLLDVAEWAVLAALQHARRPEMTVRGEEIIVHPPHERDPVPLSLHHLPVCVTFAITFDAAAAELQTKMPPPLASAASTAEQGSSALQPLHAVVDPTQAECMAANSLVTVTTNAEGQVCGLEKTAGGDVQWPLVLECTATATALVPAVLEVMSAAMATHDQRRHEARQGHFLWARSRAGVGKTDSREPNTAARAAEDPTTSAEVQGEAKRPRVEA